MSDTVEKIKERLSIVDVVGAYVKLTRAGKYWKGLSPFTKEKTPSFFVTPDRGLYHCFSTGKGGDMFTFIEEMEGVDFRGALKLLADKAGVEVVQEAPGVRGEREELYAALGAADQYFRSVLSTRTDAQNYLLKRGVDQSVVDHWHIGYAPKEWHALKEALTKKGFSERTLEAAGLIKKADQSDAPGKDARTYDRFRGRIMFPIFDATGRVIAFSGRIFEDDPVHPQAKYLNSPEGPLFDKSRALYGIQDAKNAVRELGFTMLVEGQVDLVMAHRAGYRSAVATSGTAFTAMHAEILKRYSPNVLIAYDGDAAGIAAAGRASQILLPRGMNVKVVRMPPGVDPADLIHENPAAFKEAVKQALPVVDFFLAELQDKIRDPRNLKLEVGRVVLPYVALIDNALDRAHFVERVASTIGVATEAVQVELRKLPLTEQTTSEPMKSQSFLREDQGEALLFGILSTFEEAADTRAERVAHIFTHAFGAERLATLRAAEPREIEEARIIASENFFVLYEDPESQDTFISTLEQEVANRNQGAKDEYARVTRLLYDAEQKGDSAAVQRLMQELVQLSKQLN